MAGGRLTRHWDYWIGLRLHAAIPGLHHLRLTLGPHTHPIPPIYSNISFLLLKVPIFGSSAALKEATAMALYAKIQ